jgi:hypothetical protein
VSEAELGQAIKEQIEVEDFLNKNWKKYEKILVI